MRAVTHWVVLKADGSIKVRARRPNVDTLGLDEVALPLVVHIPDGWGEVYTAQALTVELPGPPEITQGAIVVGSGR